MRNFLLLLTTFFLFAALPVQAQVNFDDETGEYTIIIADRIAETAITVLGNGTRSFVGRTGLPVVVFDREGIEQLQGPDLAAMLESVPGVTVSRNGGTGSLASLHLRGAEADQVLVLRDGVPILDASAPGGGFDLSAALPGSLGKVELLRTSNSTIWGSSAIGGVLALETPRDWSGYSGMFEYGGQDSLYATGLVGLSGDVFGVSVHASGLDSAGISAAAGGSEADGVWQWQAGGEVRLTPAEGLVLRATGDLGHSTLEIDGFPAPDFVLADTGETQRRRLASGRAGFEYYRDGFELAGGYGLSDTQRDYFDSASGDAPTNSTHGRIERADLRGQWSLSDQWSLAFGGERQWSRMESLFDPRSETASSGAYGQLGYQIGGLVFNAGLRLDQHRDFGSEWSTGADGAFRLDDNWRIHASYGEAFKAPTLFQRRSEFGNPGLQPERSRSFDLGLVFSPYPFEAELTLFRRDSEDLIGFVSCFGDSEGICIDRPFGTYDNTGQARAQGIEAGISLEIGYDLWLAAGWTHIETSDRTPDSPNRGNHLSRRPQDTLTLKAQWQDDASQLTLSADIRIASSSFDDAANLVRLDGYALGTIRASIPLAGDVELFGRVENVWDERYQTAAGYGSPGRSAHLGARARW